MAWDKDNGYLDIDNGWFDRDHSEDYWRGVWDTFVYLRGEGHGDFLSTTLAHSAKELLPEDYTAD